MSFAGSAAIVAAHVLLRSTWWRYEWGWAWYQFHFATIILAPFVAGLACAWGTQWAKSRAALGTAPGAVPAVAGLVLGTWIPAVGAYVVGLAAVSIAVSRTSGTGPDLRLMLTLGPPMAVLFASCAGGFAVGFRWGNRVLAPLVAVATFAGLLAGYTLGPARFVKVGGATATLLGLATRPAIQVGQVLLYLGAGTCATVAVASVGTRWGAEVLRRSAVPSVMVLAGAALLMGAGDREFDSLEVDLVCEGISPVICVAEGYHPVVGEVRAALAPHYRALRSASLPVPPTLVQLPVPALPDGVVVDPVSILRSPQYSDGYLLSGFIPDGCARVAASYRAGQGFAVLADYLQRTYRETEVVITDAERDALHRAYRDLVECRA